MDNLIHHSTPCHCVCLFAARMEWVYSEILTVSMYGLSDHVSKVSASKVSSVPCESATKKWSTNPRAAKDKYLDLCGTGRRVNQEALDRNR